MKKGTIKRLYQCGKCGGDIIHAVGCKCTPEHSKRAIFPQLGKDLKPMKNRVEPHNGLPVIIKR